MSWSENIFLLRTRANLTQRQVAQAIGVTDQTISNWETGVYKPRLTPKQTRALLQLFQCTLDELVEATEEDTEK